MQQGRSERRERDQPEQDEGHTRGEEFIELVGCPDVGIRDGRAGGREDAGDVGGRKAGDAGKHLSPASQFTGCDQPKREQRAQEHAHAGPEPSLLDRIAQQQETTDRNRDTAGPHGPLRAKALFKTRTWRAWAFRGRRGRRWRSRGLRPRRRLGLRRRDRGHRCLGWRQLGDGRRRRLRRRRGRWWRLG